MSRAGIECGENVRIDGVLCSFPWTLKVEIIRPNAHDDPIFRYPPGA